MSKYNERIKARQLRKNGVSIVVIASMLGVTKSSVSAWCRDITLTPEQKQKQKDTLKERYGVSNAYMLAKRDKILEDIYNKFNLESLYNIEFSRVEFDEEKIKQLQKAMK